MTVEPEPSPEAEREERPKSSRVPRWLVVTAALALAGVVVVIVYGYLATPGWIGVSGKKFWDYLELLIVPAALALGVAWLNWAQERERLAQEAHREREREAEAEQRERDRVTTEEARKAREIEVENQRAQDAALQACLDQMSQLLLDKDRPLRRSKEEDEVRMLARARTLTVLARLDPDRKGSVLRFLYETNLINKENPIVKLSGISILGSISGAADLSGVDLAFIYMGDVDLTGTLMTDADLAFCHLPGADLREADLSRATLTHTDLSEADLRFTVLAETNLAGAILSSANLQCVRFWNNDLTGADLSNANLREADFAGSITGPLISDDSDADFGDAILTDANLAGADLTDATITEEQLAQCASLEGATMPDGQILKGDTNPDGPTFEDWLKSREEDGG